MSHRRATDVLAAFWDGKLPVDVVAIAQKMGAHVFSSPSLGPLSGKVELVDGLPHIYCNSAESTVRQRFTIAHEIGHLALGHVSPEYAQHREDPASNFSGVVSPIEREANAFAAQLLMPENVLEYAVNDERISDVARLARMFDVSQIAMKYRLQNMGLLEQT